MKFQSKDGILIKNDILLKNADIGEGFSRIELGMELGTDFASL